MLPPKNASALEDAHTVLLHVAYGTKTEIRPDDILACMNPLPIRLAGEFPFLTVVCAAQCARQDPRFIDELLPSELT